MTLSEIITHVLYYGHKNYEPVRSTRLRSVRELKFGPHYIRHRFPFKGGISIGSTMARNMLENNTLYIRLKSKRKIKESN